MKKLHAIIPAGGAGTRLWPLSRRNSPKFLLDLLGQGNSLLQQTVLRLLPVAESITVVTGQAHVAAVRRQCEVLQDSGAVPADFPLQFVAEPSPRDSMAAIGLATYLIGQRHGPQAVVGSFAADHVIESPEQFWSAVGRAIDGANAGYLCTIGIAPTFPSSGFGYIKPGVEKVAGGVLQVERFVEKPSQDIAAVYVEEGYLWNAGMFVTKVEVLTEHLRSLHPEMADSLGQIASSWEEFDNDPGLLQGPWTTLERIAIDHALAEPVAARGGVAVTPMTEAGWSDLGDFTAVAEAKREAAPPDDPLSILLDSDGAIVHRDAGKVVVVLGIPGAIVVDTPDALLVTTSEHAQDVKRAVDHLQSEGNLNLI